MGKLTVKGIAKLPAGRHPDGNTLYLLVTAGKGGTLRRSWVQRLVVGGRRRDVGLGSVEFVTLAQARELAFENRVAARRGADPFAGKRQSQIPTFRQAAAKVATANRSKWSSVSAATRIAALERHVMPILGDRRVDQIGKADVLKVLTPVWSSSPAIARKVKTYLRGIIAWAVAHDHAEHNVVDAVNGALPSLPTVAHHRAMPYRDVPAALRKIEDCGASQSSRAALRFVVLTACRSGEVRGARWSEVDIEARTWTIPASRMKAGHEHRVPLSDAALAVLEAVRPLRRANDLLFPSPTVAGSLSSATLRNTMTSAGLGDAGSPHGFRSSFRDWAGEQTDADHAVMELSLAHTVGSAVERSYARSTLVAKRRGLMNAWAAYVVGVASSQRVVNLER